MGLIPREEKYFQMLSQLATKASEAGEIFARVFHEFHNHAQFAEEIKAVETASDELAAQITQKLNSTFITPIDREDIYLLVTEIDDVIDMINDIARRMDIYGISAPRADSRQIADLLNRTTVELKDAFTVLERGQDVGDHCRKIRQLEREGDTLYREAIRQLFKEEKDAVEVIKWMSIYEELENSIDRCKDVAEVLEAVVVKNK
ncbi:MAG TPA: DUF47 family protein [Blastocatellia bacterium]|jgi:predicted phosphate transport protein (TIGR00153 family)